MSAKLCVLLCLLLWEDKSEGVVPASEHFPSDLKEEEHQRERIGKKESENKSYRKSRFLKHLHDSLRVFPDELLSAPSQAAITHRQIWRRNPTKQVTVNLQNNSGRSRSWRTANREGGSGHTCKTHSRSSRHGGVYRAVQDWSIFKCVMHLQSEQLFSSRLNFANWDVGSGKAVNAHWESGGHCKFFPASIIIFLLCGNMGGRGWFPLPWKGAARMQVGTSTHGKI